MSRQSQSELAQIFESILKDYLKDSLAIRSEKAEDFLKKAKGVIDSASYQTAMKDLLTHYVARLEILLEAKSFEKAKQIHTYISAQDNTFNQHKCKANNLYYPALDSVDVVVNDEKKPTAISPVEDNRPLNLPDIQNQAVQSLNASNYLETKNNRIGPALYANPFFINFLMVLSGFFIVKKIFPKALKSIKALKENQQQSPNKVLKKIEIANTNEHLDDEANEIKNRADAFNLLVAKAKSEDEKQKNEKETLQIKQRADAFNELVYQAKKEDEKQEAEKEMLEISQRANGFNELVYQAKKEGEKQALEKAKLQISQRANEFNQLVFQPKKEDETIRKTKAKKQNEKIDATKKLVNGKDKNQIQFETLQKTAKYKVLEKQRKVTFKKNQAILKVMDETKDFLDKRTKGCLSFFCFDAKKTKQKINAVELALDNAKNAPAITDKNIEDFNQALALHRSHWLNKRVCKSQLFFKEKIATLKKTDKSQDNPCNYADINPSVF